MGTKWRDYFIHTVVPNVKNPILFILNQLSYISPNKFKILFKAIENQLIDELENLPVNKKNFLLSRNITINDRILNLIFFPCNRKRLNEPEIRTKMEEEIIEFWKYKINVKKGDKDDKNKDLKCCKTMGDLIDRLTFIYHKELKYKNTPSTFTVGLGGKRIDIGRKAFMIQNDGKIGEKEITWIDFIGYKNDPSFVYEITSARKGIFFNATVVDMEDYKVLTEANFPAYIVLYITGIIRIANLYNLIKLKDHNDWKTYFMDIKKETDKNVLVFMFNQLNLFYPEEYFRISAKLEHTLTKFLEKELSKEEQTELLNRNIKIALVLDKIFFPCDRKRLNEFEIRKKMEKEIMRVWNYKKEMYDKNASWRKNYDKFKEPYAELIHKLIFIYHKELKYDHTMPISFTLRNGKDKTNKNRTIELLSKNLHFHEIYSDEVSYLITGVWKIEKDTIESIEGDAFQEGNPLLLYDIDSSNIYDEEYRNLIEAGFPIYMGPYITEIIIEMVESDWW